MANVTGPRNTQVRLTPYDMLHEPIVATGQTIYFGQQVGFNSSGLLVATGFVRVLGMACETIISSVAGATCKVRQGISKWTNAAGGAAVVAADRGTTTVYSIDNQTVGITNTDPPAGVFYDFDTDGGVWVLSTIEPQVAGS